MASYIVCYERRHCKSLGTCAWLTLIVTPLWSKKYTAILFCCKRELPVVYCKKSWRSACETKTNIQLIPDVVISMHALSKPKETNACINLQSYTLVVCRQTWDAKYRPSPIRWSQAIYQKMQVFQTLQKTPVFWLLYRLQALHSDILIALHGDYILVLYNYIEWKHADV